MGEQDHQHAGSEVGRTLASLRRKRMKVCPVCGETFAAFGKQIYNSEQCAWKAWYERAGRERRREKRASNAPATGGKE